MIEFGFSLVMVKCLLLNLLNLRNTFRTFTVPTLTLVLVQFLLLMALSTSVKRLLTKTTNFVKLSSRRFVPINLILID